MVNQKNIIIAGLLIVCGIVAFFILSQSDEAKIKKKFHKLAEKIEKNGNEHDLIAAKTAHEIEQMFTGSVRIQIPSYSVDKTFPRSEISPHVLYTRALYRKMSLEFYDFKIEIAEGNTTAVVGLTGIFKATTSSNERVNEIHEVECTLEKMEDEWMFTGIRGIEVLER
ncbi:MAG: hypothetical protein PF482_10600 [Desulfobacteraceae bacterium]|jgi:hypothetical protein|nr:hypothetical protein [Desulfobacteraceae bacterium]